MTIDKPTSSRTALVAIDIAKYRNAVLIEVPGRSKRRRLTVLNTKEDHDRLIEMLAQLDQPIIAGFEATGNYHRCLAFRLQEEGFGLHLISSLALARTREALNNSWDSPRERGASGAA